jgi:hypothetical protein
MRATILLRSLGYLLLGGMGCILLLNALTFGAVLSVNSTRPHDASYWEVLVFFILLLVTGGGTLWHCLLRLRENFAQWDKVSRQLLRPASVEDRLDQLERLKRRAMVTPEEYTAKRQEILKDL